MQEAVEPSDSHTRCRPRAWHVCLSCDSLSDLFRDSDETHGIGRLGLLCLPCVHRACGLRSDQNAVTGLKLPGSDLWQVGSRALRCCVSSPAGLTHYRFSPPDNPERLISKLRQQRTQEDYTPPRDRDRAQRPWESVEARRTKAPAKGQKRPTKARLYCWLAIVKNETLQPPSA